MNPFRLSLLLFLPLSSFSQNIDINLLRSVNSGNSTCWDNTNKVFSKSITPVTIAVPAGLLLYGVLCKDSTAKKNSITMGASLAACGLITVGMKYAFNRPRPFVTYPDLITKKSDAGTPSFPSGHTSQSFATAASISLMYPKWYVIAPSFLWAGMVSYSRMELGVHYPSDVLAGAILGAGTSFLAWKIKKRWERKEKEGKKNQGVP